MEQTEKPLRIALVMDNGIYRECMTLMIGTATRHGVVVSVGDARAYEAACATMPPPDITLVDLDGRPQEGVDLIAWIVSHQPATLPLACGHTLEERWVRRALEVGSRGYLATTCTKEAFLAALDELGATGDYSTAQVRVLRERMAADLRGRERVIAAITKREMEVLQLLCVAAHHSYKHVAGELGMSRRTVEWHCGNMMEKLGVNSRAGLMLAAVRWELVRV